MDNIIVLISAVVLMCVLGAALGAVIGIFVKLFKVKSDPRADFALELLPGANCGGCGFAGCADFAELFVVVKLAVKSLSCEAFTAGHITVRL